MNASHSTPQESFWAGEFGDRYIERNRSARLAASNLHFFAHALRAAGAFESCVELGANIGMNLRALRALYPSLECDGVEINPTAAKELVGVIGKSHVHQGSILEWVPSRQWDLAFTKTVMIHIAPIRLPEVYDLLAKASRRFVLIAEYYNPSPTSVSYRGHDERLFKRDFAGEFIDRHPQFQLVDYGFVYRRDPAFPQDDITWFLLRRESTDR